MDNVKLRALLDQALRLAEEAQALNEVPVGALVIDPVGDLLGAGFNRRETDQDPCSHAEIRAIQAAAKALNSWRLIDCTLVVTLEPCPMCLGALQQARIARVIYGAPDPKGGALSLGYRLHEDARTNHRFTVEHLAHPACGEILTRFFKQRRNRSSEESGSSPAPSSQ